MKKLFTILILALLVGCGDLPAPAQYDHSMLREYFGESPAEVEKAFGAPASIATTGSEPEPDMATEELQESKRSTKSFRHTYSTVDGDLVFDFNPNDEVFAITYAGSSVAAPSLKNATE